MQAHVVEGRRQRRSLWNAIRALEEPSMLVRQAARHLRDEHGEELLEDAEDTQRRANLVRQAVFTGDDCKPGQAM